MTDAVIVSTARTPLGKSWRGSFNMTHGATLAGHAIEHAVKRAGVDPAEIEDVVMGCALPQGATGLNIGRYAAMRAGTFPKPLRIGKTAVAWRASDIEAWQAARIAESRADKAA